MQLSSLQTASNFIHVQYLFCLPMKRRSATMASVAATIASVAGDNAANDVNSARGEL